MEKIFKENLQTNLNEIKERKISLSSKPIKLNVVLTTKCNLNCLMCEVRRIPWQIPEKVIREVVCFFPYLQEIIWQGGEVFLLDYFKELLESASIYPDLTHEITTNGHLIEEEWMQIFNRINLNLNISIDAVTKQTYEYIRKGSKFEDLIRTLELINETKNRVDGKRLVLVMIVTVMRSNYHELEKIIEFAKRFKFDRVVLQPIKGNFDNGENFFFNHEEEILRYIDEVKQLMKKEAGDSGIKLLEWLPTSFGSKQIFSNEETPRQNCIEDKGDRLLCYAPWQQMFIEWGGDVYPHCLCIQDGPNKAKRIGNVFEESLTEIWNEKKMQNFRKKIIDNDLINLCNPDCLSGLISADVRDIPLKL